MVVHISLIGRNPNHIWDGLKELIPAEKLYLLHSPNTPNEKFETIAKKTKKEVEKNFCKTILVKINAFDMMSVWNTIDKIVTDEMNEDTMLSPRDFAVNVTGGTNMMAAAATVAAAPRVEEETVTLTKYEHNLVKVDHFLTKGDGTQEGDLAMLKVDGHYQAHVLRNGKWRRQFTD